MSRECPKCLSSEDILTERRPDGDSTCQACNYKGKTAEFDLGECKNVYCGSKVEAVQYDYCKKCWWDQDPRNIKNGGTVDLEKHKMKESGPKLSDVVEPEDEMMKDREDSLLKGPQRGPPPPPMSVNGRVIVETYKEDRGLKATVSNGFAMVQQKVQVVGLKVLADARIGDEYVRKGDTVYIKEGSLQSAPWAKASFTADIIEGQFMILESLHIEFVVRK